ncbi:MAG: aminopeptidase P family protein [Acidobacteria bacterium]|nr:aminopeptidase P family protein [Acidobacteriota bacterium]
MTAAKHLLLAAATTAAIAVGEVRPSAQSRGSYPDPAVRVLTHREQNELVTPWIKKRFDTLLPGLMAREGIDMWIIPTREYNEDPVFASMSPLTYFASRRRTILVFYNPGGGRPVERYSIGRFDYDRIYTPIPTSNDGQHAGLRTLVEEKQPKVIGINESDAWNHADGLTANEKRRLLDALGPTYAARVKSAEMLAVGWLEVKLPEELEAYRHAMKAAHMVIREAFSNTVITPGTTTSQDVVWWMRQRVAELGLGSWFQPSINIARRGEKGTLQGVIQPGDMLHTDFGIVYMGFSTDTQHNAYVLRPGETDAPQGLKDGLKAANRLQDLTMQYARVERTGNEALADALAHAKKEGLVPSIYCHAIGYHGHGAGPPIGMSDYQSGVPVRGDYVFRPSTWHSIELNATHPVPEWNNQPVRFALEEDAALMPDGKWDWIDGRQTEFYLIRP